MVDVNIKIKNCIDSVKCIHLNWMAIVKYLLKWAPFGIIVGVAIGLIASLFDYILVLINDTIMLNTYILHRKILLLQERA